MPNGSIGARLKALRLDRGLTQDEVGKRVLVSKQTLYKYENDIVTNIPVDKIELLAEVYHVTPAYIMGWEQPEEDIDDSPSYYDDPEVAAIANEMKENPNIRVLFDASRGLSKESIEEVRRFVEYQKAKERGDYDY
ncbi:MAG: helix-turn-helix domain-containing protein [Selenomonas noxia]